MGKERLEDKVGEEINKIRSTVCGGRK